MLSLFQIGVKIDLIFLLHSRSILLVFHEFRFSKLTIFLLIFLRGRLKPFSSALLLVIVIFIKKLLHHVVLVAAINADDE